MGDLILLAIISIVFLIFPLAVHSQFISKYYYPALTPVPILLNCLGLFSIIVADMNGKMLWLSIFFCVTMYAISIFLNMNMARELGSTKIDTIKLILANALIPVSIILVILYSLISTPNKKKKR